MSIRVDCVVCKKAKAHYTARTAGKPDQLCCGQCGEHMPLGTFLEKRVGDKDNRGKHGTKKTAFTKHVPTHRLEQQAEGSLPTGKTQGIAGTDSEWRGMDGLVPV